MIMTPELESNIKEKFEIVLKIRQELSKESDRGACLMAAAFLEQELESLLSQKLVGSKKHHESLFEFNGPLGTFSSKIKMAYSLGFIGRLAFIDLEQIRKIRNEFGHMYEPINFETDSIKDRIGNLKSHYFDKKVTPSRAIFLNSVTGLLAIIHAASFKFQKFKEASDNLVYDLHFKEKRKEAVHEIVSKLIEQLKADNQTNNK